MPSIAHLIFLFLASLLAAFSMPSLAATPAATLAAVTISFPNAARYLIPTPLGPKSLTLTAHWSVPPPPTLHGSTTWQRFAPQLCARATYSDLTTTSTPLSSSAAPLVNDCLALHNLLHRGYDAGYRGGNGMGKFAGHWTVTQRDLRENTYVGLAGFGTCAVVVGIRKGEERGGKVGDDEGSRKEGGREVLGELHWGFAVGTEDVRELVWESVAKFQRGGVVESRGSVPCLTWVQRGPTVVAVDWGVVRMEESWVQVREGKGGEGRG